MNNRYVFFYISFESFDCLIDVFFDRCDDFFFRFFFENMIEHKIDSKKKCTILKKNFTNAHENFELNRVKTSKKRFKKKKFK